ncbi:putative immunoglobulin-like protein [Helianthus annuus]|nr:putative immunoglobulin-like protein [Helianthus annuus]
MISTMTLSHVILPSYKLFFFAAPEPRFSQLRHPHGGRFLAGVCASSSSPSKTSVGRRRQTKTNADLCNDLREFISEIGLPDGHVPSLKELSQHGRQDLANIVRRRGYKLIKELLAASQEITVSDSDAEGSLTEDKANKEVDELTGSEDPSSKVLCESDSASLDLENGSVLTSQLVDSTSQLRNITSSDQVASDEAANTDKDLEVEVEVEVKVVSYQLIYFMITKEDEAEINRIKVMLHNKELELSQLKEEIEKNKQALSELQAKAETEISKAQKLLLDKDAELLAAEESLSGLKQVQVEYWGEGETVQVAGSFNGWHHGVTLDPQPTSNITDPVELRF